MTEQFYEVTVKFASGKPDEHIVVQAANSLVAIQRVANYYEATDKSVPVYQLNITEKRGTILP